MPTPHGRLRRCEGLRQRLHADISHPERARVPLERRSRKPAILKEISGCKNGTPDASKFSKKRTTALLAHDFDKDAILTKRLPYERLDQLTIDLLLGIR